MTQLPRDKSRSGVDGVGAFGWVTSGRVPALDGLRGIAVLLLILRHSAATDGFPFPTVARFAEHLELAPDLFFVISGFLITLVLRRQFSTGSSSPVAFYKRRFRRLCPPFAVYVGVVAILTLLGIVHVSGRTWFGTLTYTLNFVRRPDWQLGHFWSLSVEEQFYLLWPLVLLRARGKELGTLAACLALAPFLRLFVWTFDRANLDMVDSWSPTRADFLIVGCALAFLAMDERFRRVTTVAAPRAGLAVSLAILALAVSEAVGVAITAYQLTLGLSIKALCIGTVLWSCVNAGPGLITRVLHSRLLVQVGAMSYSLYIWQQLFLNPHSASWACRWPVNIVLALLAATISYRFIEVPLLRQKARKSVGAAVQPAAPERVSPATPLGTATAPAQVLVQ